MSIIPLIKISVLGLLEQKESVLSDLQKLGCIHITSGRASSEREVSAGISPETRRALAFIVSCPHRRTQVRSARGFDAESVQNRALELEKSIHRLRDERDSLEDRIKHLKPWGNFQLPSLDDMRNLRLWFYLVPHHLKEKIDSSEVNWAIVNRDERCYYVVVVSDKEPQGMPVARTLTGSRSLSELEQRLIDVENEIEDLEAERYSMTRWADLFAKSLNQLEDRQELKRAYGRTVDSSPLFALEGWAPRECLQVLTAYSDTHDVALHIREPESGETPPTLLRNPPVLGGGQDLLTFYMTPGYWLSDPSIIVFFSFITFFALILADAGYALILGAGLLLIWRNMGSSESGRRLRILFAALVATSAIWGIVVGSYFGREPEKGTFLAGMKLLDLNDYGTMMAISIGIGAFHICLANVMVILRRGWNALSLAPLGWISIIIGSLSMVAGGGTGSETGNVGLGMLIGGILAVLLFSGAEHPPVARFLEGLERLTHLSNAFGDVMSYLRLFALGLASSSLAIAFNDLARQVAEAVIPGMGFLSFLVLLIGHGLNLVLGIMAGVVHGLRLNVIEFLNWSTPEEGYPFRAFAKKEVQ